jgi:gamma-carbonic anhydrase
MRPGVDAAGAVPRLLEPRGGAMPGLLILPYGGVEPTFGGAPVHTGAGAAVLGRVTLGSRAWLGSRAVVRGDGHYVEIGDDFRLGAGGTVHIAHDLYPTHIGAGVTAGRNSVIHACDVGDGCWIGHDVVILDGSRIGPGAALADGTVVFPRSELEGGWLYEGQPARPVRRLEAGEIEALHATARAEADEHPAASPAQADGRAAIFVAATATLSGPIELGEGAGIWYGCRLKAGDGEIIVGSRTNVQDNSVLLCAGGSLRIGSETTIGHNVRMTDTVVGDGSLVGIGAVLAAGTVVEDDVLVAAGARTEPGQRLSSGWLWGGCPARPLKLLDARRRDIIARIWPLYREYGATYAAIEAATAR